MITRSQKIYFYLEKNKHKSKYISDHSRTNLTVIHKTLQQNFSFINNELQKTPWIKNSQQIVFKGLYKSL